MRRVPLRDLVVLILSLSALAAAGTVLRLLPDVSTTTVSLAFLLVVLATATVGHLWAAIVVSIAAMLTLNFFFLPPLGTFTIADPQNWIALFAFLVVAVIASNLSAAAQARTSEAIASRNEVTRLFDLTRDVLLTTETAGAIDALARHVARRFELPKIAICLPTDNSWRIHQGGSEDISIDTLTLNMALAKARGTVEYDARRRAYGGHVQIGGADGYSLVPLRHGTKAVGLLAASSTLDIGSLDALAGVVAIAIERAQFLAERDAAELVRQKADLAANGSIQVAQDKARSSALFRSPSKVFMDRLANGETYLLRLSGATPIAGAMPIVVGGKVIGAIGISGASALQDHQVAQAGASAVK